MSQMCGSSSRARRKKDFTPSTVANRGRTGIGLEDERRISLQT
jgi:hypothetical protein